MTVQSVAGWGEMLGDAYETLFRSGEPWQFMLRALLVEEAG